MTKGERFIAEFEADFAARSPFVRDLAVGMLCLNAIGLDFDIETGVVRPSVTVLGAASREVKLHENCQVYDPEYDTAGQLIEMLMDSLKLPEPEIRERLKKAGLLEDDLD